MLKPEVALPRDVVFETKKDIEHPLVKYNDEPTLSRRKTSESNWAVACFDGQCNAFPVLAYI